MTASVGQAHVSAVRVERVVDCPFSLATELASIIFPALERAGDGVRLPFRAFALPLRGGIARSVEVRYRRQPDRCEPGHAHDEISFDWNAHSRFLPNFSGTLRFRIEATRTRIVLAGAYAPPLGALGALFDRVLGGRLAQATARDLVDRTALALEEKWAAERRAAVTI